MTGTRRASWRRYVPVLAVGAVVYAADQLSKRAVLENLGPQAGYPQVQVLGDYLRISFTTNTGAAFGLFPQATLLLTIAALLAVPILFWLQGSMLREHWVTQISLGLLLGGTLGNLTDRVRLGYVVDFIDAGINSLRWYTFNVADSAFVIGVIIISFYLLLYPEAIPANQDA